MKLSASLIANELKKLYSLTLGETMSLLPNLERVQIDTGTPFYLENTIYIRSLPFSEPLFVSTGDMNSCQPIALSEKAAEPDDSVQTDHSCSSDASDLTQKPLAHDKMAPHSLPESSMMIFIGSVAADLKKCPVNCCAVSTSEVTPAVMVNQILDIFEKFNRWNEELIQHRLRDSSIQAMLEISYPIFGNPLMVMGMDFTIIAKMFPETTPFQETIYGSQEDTYRYINAIKQDPLYNQVREQNGYFLYSNPTSDVSSLCVNIKKYDVTSYRLMLMDYETPLNEVYGFLLEDLATYIEHALLHNTIRHTSRNTSLHSVFLHILSDRTADYVTISQKLDSLGWYSKNEYFCVVLQTSYLDQQNLTANAICTYVQNIIENSCALPFKDNIVIYINMSRAHLTIDDITEKLTYFIRDSYLKAGFSRVMVGHLNLRRQYVQATLALDVGGRKHPFQWIHRFNEISFDYILEQSTKRLPGYMISHEKLLLLKTLDENGNTEYFKTLRVYLDNHLNAVQSARILYIHRSTFLYRLEKIKAVLETDLTDPEEILYLMLSFRFIDLENQTGVEEDQP
ncbi:MAG: helix-turn-helix domain-containing protein [Clostridiales bacterium]|nr:helix-turn-helix domain-containing protein [Clostridiales bacterium]